MESGEADRASTPLSGADSAFVGDVFTVVRRAVGGFELFSVACDGREDVLWIDRHASPAREAFANVVFLAMVFGSLYVSAALAPQGHNSWPRMLVIAAAVLVGAGTGLFAKEWMLSGREMTVHSESTAGPVLLRIMEPKYAPFRASAFTVRDFDRAPLGFFNRSRDASRTVWSCLDAEGNLSWTASFDAAGQFGWGAALSAMFLPGPSIQQSKVLRFTLNTPNGQTWGLMQCNSPNPGAVTLDLSPDPDFVIDRRLAVPLAIKASFGDLA